MEIFEALQSMVVGFILECLIEFVVGGPAPGVLDSLQFDKGVELLSVWVKSKV